MYAISELPYNSVVDLVSSIREKYIREKLGCIRENIDTPRKRRGI